jgi:hypothetical protein
MADLVSEPAWFAHQASDESQRGRQRRERAGRIVMTRRIVDYLIRRVRIAEKTTVIDAIFSLIKKYELRRKRLNLVEITMMRRAVRVDKNFTHSV